MTEAHRNKAARFQQADTRVTTAYGAEPSCLLCRNCFGSASQHAGFGRDLVNVWSDVGVQLPQGPQNPAD
ncbi:hypothetical protein HRbin36_00336 [bacterium HR36]|nr:hypothetical protein HRbin36_00336 [bacterium HR36]